MMQDRVMAHDQERIDRPDFDALQALIYSALQSLVGGIFGPCGGLLSPLKWAKSNAGGVYRLTLDRFMGVHTRRAATRVEDRGFAGSVNVGARWAAQVISFGPSEEGHVNHPINYTAARAAEIATPGTKPFIWCRVVEVPADVDVRRIWNVGSGAEAPVAVATRVRQRLEFAVSTLEPAAGDVGTWTAIARVYEWAGNDISLVRGLSAWDDPHAASTLQDVGAALPGYQDPESDNSSFAHPLQRLLESDDLRDDGSVASWPEGLDRSAGLPYHLQWIRSRFALAVSGGEHDPEGTIVRPWWSAPELSLNGAKVLLDEHTTQIALAAVGVAQANQRHVVLAAGVLHFQPAGVWPDPHDNAAWLLRQGWGVHAVSFSDEHTVAIRFLDSQIVSRTDWYVSSVTTTPVWTPGHITGAHGGYQLLPRVLPAPQSNPATWTGPSPLSSYQGATVGLAAGQYGVQLSVTKTTIVADELVTALPADGEMDAGGGLAFSFVVHISKYKFGNAGI